MKPSLNLLLTLMVAGIADAREFPVTSSRELVQAAAAVRPGDTIVLSGGPFSGIHLSEIRGNKAAPIIIRGQSAENPARFKGGKTGIQLSRCEWLELRFLDVRSAQYNGINLDDDGDREHPARHILIEDCSVTDIGPRGNFDGLKMSGIDDFTVRRCTFSGWGGSAIDMVGCHNGRIEECRLVGKDGFSQNSGLQMKGGTTHIKVIGNFFKDAGQRSINVGGSTGLEFFRPEVGDFEAERIEIAGNRFSGSSAPIAWVTSNAGHVHHNTFHLPEKWIARILQENADKGFKPVQGGIFEHNLITFDQQVRTFINIGPDTAANTFVFRNNVWFDQSGGSRTPQLPGQVSGETHGIDPELIHPGQPDMTVGSKNPVFKNCGADAFRLQDDKKARE